MTSSSSRIVSTVHAWRHIARRHLKARQQAENENRRLREQLVEHLKWSNALQAKMNQRTTSGGRESPRAAAAAAALGTVANPLLLAEDEEGITDLELELDDTDRSELEMLTTGLDSAYVQVDSVFKEHSVSEVPLGAVSGSRKTLDEGEDDEHNGMATVELRDTRVIPFDFKLAIDAALNAWVLWHLGGSCRKCLGSSELFIPRCFETGTYICDLNLVLRRYVEHDHLVLIWRGLSAGEKDLDGLFTDETGWVLIEKMAPFTQNQTSENGVGVAARTSMRSCVRMTPKRADDCTPTPVQGQIVTNLVVNSYEEDVSFIYREMEAQLLRMTRHV